VSILEKMGLNAKLLNLHVGWAPESTEINTYRRKVAVMSVDKLFFADEVFK
jgi:hypothetical protein